jgi:predicted RNA polymerase sigma factor
VSGGDVEGLLREVAPPALGALVRRYGDFAAAEDALQEALLAAALSWPRQGCPDNPVGWLVRVGGRRLADEHRADIARRRREQVDAEAAARPPATTDRDDTLLVMLMCCHPALTPAAAVPLTLRAVSGLSTREIAAAFLVPEATMAQRISRAKATLRTVDGLLDRPSPQELPGRLGALLRVLYLVFNEGYASSSGPQLSRTDLSGEAVRLARLLHRSLPEDPEVAGLLALLLLTDARRPARTGPDGELVPLSEQDRRRWDRALILEGTRLVTSAVQRGGLGPYATQAAIAAVHDQASSFRGTEWLQVLALYDVLVASDPGPLVRLNRAVALAMVDGPGRGLVEVDALMEQLQAHHRWHAVRAHLLDLSGDAAGAAREYRAAADRAHNLRERSYLTACAARVGAEPPV